MRWIDTVASYVPSLIVTQLVDSNEATLPRRQRHETVCVFADVSGFTALSEAMMLQEESQANQASSSSTGAAGEGVSVAGVEGLAKHLNAYFGQMVRIIAREGGDVFKFAGDAMIVLWPLQPKEGEEGGEGPRAGMWAGPRKRGMERENSGLSQSTPADLGHSPLSAAAGGDSNRNTGSVLMERKMRMATQCAFSIQEELHDCILAKDVKMGVKIGIGMGNVAVLHLGGVHKRMEYIAVGEPLLQAFQAEHHCKQGQVIVSEPAFKFIRHEGFTAVEVYGDMCVRVEKVPGYVPIRRVNVRHISQLETCDNATLEMTLRAYIPGAVLRNLRPDSPQEEQWSNEIRCVTVLFANLGLKEHHLLAAAQYREAMDEVHHLMLAVQKAVYEYEGSINKFLMDDKGSTLVAVFGLPPVAHTDDAARGVLAGLRLCEHLFDLGLKGSIGLTTGRAFCGVVGSKTRREYTVLGDTVNLSARLMQRATAYEGGLLCDLAVQRACSGLLQFIHRGNITVKGKKQVVQVFQPYPPDFPPPQAPEFLGENIFRLIHRQQKQNFVMHHMLNSFQAFFHRPRMGGNGNIGGGGGRV